MNTHILVVDDEPKVRLNYRTTLETEGYTVLEADRGAKALQYKKHYGQAIKLNSRYGPAQQNLRRLCGLLHLGSSKEPLALGCDQ